MALDLIQTVQQIDDMAQRLGNGQDDRAARLERALEAMKVVDPSELKHKVDSSQGRPYLCAGIVDGFAGRHSPSELPQDYCVAATDGSHIDVDRHVPVRCYLINLGTCILTYGTQPDARLSNAPKLYSEEDDLYLVSSAAGSLDTVEIKEQLLGLKRSVEEVEALASAVETIETQEPLLGLIDGSFVLWGLAGRGFQPFVREEIIGHGLLPALDRLQKQAQVRNLAVASYISLPGSTEVVNTLRLSMCPKDQDECNRSCNSHRSSNIPCNTVNGFLDRTLFQGLLEPGERSSTFRTHSSVSRDNYGPHQIHFYYLNTGDEIARVEVPQWIAEDEAALALSHSLILDQCRLGMGYPVAISEAHEQAVINGQDRELFKNMVDEALLRRHLPVFSSEKARSKRTPWL